jgi:ornithine cyclodeaminase/alanine dehydrogenase-like protein (mu-crystallin family)
MRWLAGEPAPPRRDALTVWKSVGSPDQDLIAAWHAWRNARVPQRESQCASC